MIRTITLGLFLYALWLLLSGYFQHPLLLSLGAASCLVAILISRRMDFIDHEGHPIHITPRGIGYFPWLLKEIILSNIHVVRVILSPSLPIAPKLFTVRASQRDELGQVVYANSITLTPGTISVNLERDLITVHALTANTKAGLETGEMDRRVSRLMHGGPRTKRG